jgi:hypothetical protein
MPPTTNAVVGRMLVPAARNRRVPHGDHDKAARRERGSGQIAGKSMRGQERERNDRLEHRRQEAEKDQRRQRDDVGHVGRARSVRRAHCATTRHRRHGEAYAEEECQDGSSYEKVFCCQAVPKVLFHFARTVRRSDG